MVWVAGVDGCRGGWFRVARQTETGDLRFDLIAGAAHFLVTEPKPSIVAVDIPIGLPKAGSRECDLHARKLLGPRRNSVFPAPIRPAMKAATREEAACITFEQDGRRVSAQAWGIYPKIREMDDFLQAHAAAREQVFEVHPEVCFWAWAGKKPMEFGKKKSAGKEERRLLAEAWLGQGIVEFARGEHLKKVLSDDDILDAIAALWTAHRIETGEAQVLPDAPPKDLTGISMQIVY